MSACPFANHFVARSAAPPHVQPPDKPLDLIQMLRRGLKNPLETWPQAVYEEPFARVKGPGPETIFISDPGMIQEILVSSASSFGRSKEFLSVVNPLVGGGVVTADGPEWRSQRKLIAPLFTHQREHAFVPAMVRLGQATAAEWTKRDERHRIRILDEMMQVSLVLMAQSLFSDHAHIDAKGMIDGLATYMSGATVQALYTAMGVPEWVPMPRRRLRLEARNRLHSQLRGILEQRRKEKIGPDPTASGDMLDYLLSAVDSETGEPPSDQSIIANLFTFLVGGYETTAIGLAWTLYLLAQYPEVGQRVIAEVEFVTQGQLIAAEHLKGLAYLYRVVQESMRLYPPVALIQRGVIKRSVIGDLTLEEGQSLTISPYIVHRHRKIWSMPEHFDPDNFTSDATRSRHRYSYLPFGAGGRICTGMSFAMTQTVVFVATLLRSVRITAVPDEPPSLQLRQTLRPSNGIPAWVEPRR